MPDDVVQKFIEAVDNSSDYADHLTERLQPIALGDIDFLVNSTQERDGALWENWGVPTELVQDQYDKIEIDARDLDWVEGLSGLHAAATTQFFLDQREDTLIKPLAYQEQVLFGFVLNPIQLRAAGRRGFEILGPSEYQNLRAVFLDELAFLKGLSNVQLYQNLQELGALRPFEKVVADNAGYVARMTSYRPGSLQFKEEVNKLIDVNSRRALKGMNRRSVQALYTYRETDGDFKTLMTWIVEGGKNVCGYCSSNAGLTKSYEQWIIDGQPGADVCAGGDLCRCQLMAA